MKFNVNQQDLQQALNYCQGIIEKRSTLPILSNILLDANKSHLTITATDLDLIFIESGGDNLSATFSPELADITIYVIDVASGEKIPRKGGPGITKADLLVINKIDLAPYVGANLDIMDSDTKRMRPNSPYVFSNLHKAVGLNDIINFIVDKGMLKA